MKRYAVYLTVYGGDKLPQNYIGSSSIKRILCGYRGTPSSKQYSKKFRDELKSNPNLFATFILKTFECRESALLCERYLQIKYDVVKNKLFFNKSFAIDGCFGISFSGKDNPFYGKTHSDEKKLAWSNERKGIPLKDEYRDKMINTVNKNKPLWDLKDELSIIWVNNNCPHDGLFSDILFDLGYPKENCGAIVRYFIRHGIGKYQIHLLVKRLL